MRLGWTTGKYSTTYRAVKTIRVDGKNKTIIVKSFGSEKSICEKYGVSDAKAWAQEQVRLMNQEEEDEERILTLSLNPTRDLNLNDRRSFNGGYLFLQDIYYELGLDKICTAIKTRHEFEYNLNSIVSRLIYTRILYPSSKLNSFNESQKFIEAPDFDLHQIYRALSVLASESDYIQNRLFKNSQLISTRHTEVIYYDCTNFYFEIEESEDDKQYGVSKEHRPLPIVEMGLFMDRDGIPLAFSINPGNQNEQLSLIPLEKKLLQNFHLSKFIVCTDSGLSSIENRHFNDHDDEESTRDFITTQSIKKMKKNIKDWTLDPEGWYLTGDKSKKKYNLNELDEEADIDKIYYKDRWIKEKATITTEGEETKKFDFEQHLIVSFSLKYRNYLRAIRSRQIQRAKNAMCHGKNAVERKRENDPKRFIKADHSTKDGEVAEKTTYYIDETKIAEEEKYDGFYAVCTSLDDRPEAIIKVNKQRWEIEECFRIMKTEFKARPVYVKRQERIIAHFITCFIALIVYRYLEKKLDNKYTCDQIISTLVEMNFMKYDGMGYQPTYVRTEITDALHKAFGFNTSKEIIPVKKMKKICADTKK